MPARRLLKQTSLYTAGPRENINGQQRGSNMRDVTGLFVFLLTFLMGGAGGIEPSSGYCIGNQCFAVFHHASNFTAAHDRCRAQEGHLMTVRSSVSHDILLILLGNLTGRYWIGLHQETGCSDSTPELRGFHWVTDDSESDFFNWAPGFNDSCSSQRCVSVSQEDEFQWIPEPCGEHLAGFLCEYGIIDPCKGLTAAQGETVTYRIPMGFVAEDVLSLPPGSIAVRMPGETKYVCFDKQWLQAPWSCEILEGGCDYRCTVNPQNEPSCFCPSGQTVNPTNKVTCEVAGPDDPCVALRCAHACYKKDGAVDACMCDHGFKLAQDGRSCVDFNDCRDERQCPGDNFMCVNVVGAFHCVCEDGYEARGGLCVEVDECASAPCEHICVNTPGSYECSCYDGYKEDPKAPHMCARHCGEEECVAECDPNNRFQCYCPDGYVAEERETNTVCIDMDECSFFYCDQDCENTFGSYVCTCSPGYTLVGQYTCVKNGGDTDTDGGSEGSGEGTTPRVPTTSAAPRPDPTRRPSAVSAGGLVGIIVCTAFFILLVVFLAHRVLNSRGKMESGGALKAAEDEAHGLQRVASDA